MSEYLIHLFSGLPTWLATILLAVVLIGELRAAIPVAIEVWSIRPLNAFLLSIIGNALPLIPLYFGLNVFRDFIAKHSSRVTQLIDSQINRSKKRVQEKYERYGAVALFLFTALPLPLTGLWTATIAAVALKIPFRFAAPSILFGIIVSGTVVTAITISAVAVF